MTEEHHHQKLNAQLGAMEQRLKKIQFWRAAGYTVILFLAALGLAALIDYLVPLTFSQRLVLTLAVYGSVVAYAIFGWWLPYRRPMKAEQVAWVLEELEPSFNEKLISAVEFTGQKDQKISVDMINAVLEDAEIDLAKHDPAQDFPLKPGNFALPAIAVIAFLALFFVPSLQFSRLVTRVAFPSDTQATVGSFRLIVHTPKAKKAAEASELAFEVECTDANVDEVDLIIEDEKKRRFAMSYDEERKRYLFAQGDLKQSFRFWAQSGRVQSAKHSVTVIPRPKVQDYTITYNFPSYTGMPASTTTLSTGALKGYPGTVVDLKIQATKPLKALTMTIQGTERALTMDAGGLVATSQLTLEADMDLYTLRLLDTDDLENLNALAFPIVVMEDQAPSVKILKPGGEVHLGLEDKLPLEWEAIDDFKISKQTLSWTAAGKEAVDIELDADASILDWDLSAAGLQTGDEISYRIRVEDAVGQTAESQTRHLSLLKDLALADSTAFRNIARTLAGELNGMAKRLKAVEELENKLNGNGGAAAEDLSHNRNMMLKHAQWLSDRLAETEKLTKDLQQHGFFPRAQIAAELMGRYARQERLFSTVRLTREDAGQAIEAIDAMRGLNLEAAQALLQKANEHVPAIQTRRMARTARSLEAETGQEILTRLAQRAGKIAEKHHRKSMDFFKNTDGLADKLNSLQNELDRQAGNYSELDRLIKEIRERLKSRNQQMAALARQLEMYNREQDWESVAAMRDALKQAAMQETEDLARQADLELAAKVLDKAIEEQDADRVQEVVDRLPEIDRQHELEALADEIAETREAASEVLAALKEELATSETDSTEELPEDLEALAHELDQLRERPLDGETLREDSDGRKMADQLTAADQHLAQLEQALAAGDEKRAEQELRNLESRMEQAEEVANQAAESGEEELAQNRGALENLSESLSEQLSEVARMMESDPATPAEQAQQAQAAAQEMEALAAELEREAQREIARPDGDAEEARNKLAMAESLQALNEQKLQPAAQALQAAKEPDEVSAARDALEQALAELAKSQDLAEQAEQSAKLELPLDAREAVQDELEALADETLPEQLIETLETLEQLREGSEEVEDLAAALEDRKAQPKTVAEAVDELRQDLGHALMMEGREAFMEEAEDVIAEAQRGTEELLTEARALRAEMRDAEKLNPQERAALQAEAEALTEQAEELGMDLARADAVKELLQPDAEDALDPLQQAAIPNLERAAQKMAQAEQAMEQAKAAPAEGQPALTPEQVAAKEQAAERALQEASEAMERAVAGVREADAALDAFAEELPDLEPQAQQFAQLKEEEAMRPEQMQPANAHLDRLQDLMAEAQAAQAAAEKLRDDLLPEYREAAAMLEKLPDEGLEEWQERAMDKAREAFAELENPNEMAAGLDNAANAIKRQDPQLAQELRKEAQDMRKLAQHGYQPVQELEQRTEQRMKEMASEARQLETDLEKLQAPEGESALETLDQFEENLENEDLARAEKNLDAIEADMQALAAQAAETPAPETIPVSLPRTPPQATLDPEKLLEQNPALRQAANPEADWHERKALMETAAEAMKQRPDQQIPEAELAAKGELKAAAEQASLEAAEDFAKAAELQDAMQDAQPLSDAFKKDPEAFIDQASEQIAKAQAAAEDVAKTVDQGQRPSEQQMEKLAEAVADAESMREQMGEAQHPAQDALSEQVDEALAPERPNLLEAGEGLEDVEEALAHYADALEAASGDPLAQESAKTPEAFSKPRDLLSPQKEQALAQKAAEDREGLIADAREQVKDVQQAAKKVEEQLAKGREGERETAALEDAVNELEAMRDQLGARDFKAHRALEDEVLAELGEEASPKEAAEGMKALKSELADYEKLLKAERERQKAFDEVKELAEALEATEGEAQQKPEQAKAAAEKLAAALEPRKGLASQEAAEAVKQLEEILQQADAPAESLTEAMEEVAEAVEALNPATQDSVAPNKEAFDAAAKAAALDNAEALQDALAGDYEAAAESMEALAASLPDSAQKNQAEKSAKEFTAAREEQMEDLPGDLADALEAAESAEASLPVEAAAALSEAADATRSGDLPEASERLQEAISKAKGEDQAALAKLDEEIKEAFADEKNQLAGLSEEARDALDAVGELAKQADPVSQTALAEAAEQLKQEDFGKAAENVAQAAIGLPEESLKEAAELARGLQQEDQEKFGEASEAAREGLKQLGEEQTEIAAAAKAEDYTSAAEMAQQAGQKEAAKAFEEAAAQQKAALPSHAQEGLSQLEEAIKKASGEEQAMLQEAEKAALKGAFAEAADLAAQAAQKHATEAELAKALDEAQDYQESTVKPLENAVKEAQQNRMSEAALQAAQSPAGQEAAESLQQAENQAEDAAKQAFEDAFNTPQKNSRSQLENAARSAQNNQLDQALQQARQAGQAGREAQEAFAEAKKAQEAAKQTTQQALDEAKQNSPLQAAEQALAEAKSAQQEAAQTAQAATQQAQADQQALQQAQQALSQNKPEQAAQAAAKAANASPELAQQLSALPSDAPAEAKQEAAEALQAAQQAVAEQGQQAAQDQQAAQQASQRLDRAQQAMSAGQMEQAADLAKQQAQGAFEAQQASEAFAQATAEQPGPESEMAQAQSQPGEQSPGESAQIQAGQQAQPGEPSPSQAAPSQAGQPAQAGEPSPSQATQSQAGQPAQAGVLSPSQATQSQAGQPAQAGEPSPSQAAQSQAGQPAQPGQAQPGQQPPQGGTEQAYQSQADQPPEPMPAQQEGSTPLPAQEISSAMIQLQAAQSDLLDGKASPYTADHLADAAHALEQASAALAETVLDQVNNQVADPQAAQSASQGTPQGGSGGPQGNRSPQSQAARVADLKEDFKSKGWRGPKGQLKSGNIQGDKNQYTDYYRKANAQYLEKLLKQAKQDGE